MKKLMFSLCTFAIILSTIIMLYRYGLSFNVENGVDPQLPIKTILEYIQSYDGFAAFERLVYLSNESITTASALFDIFTDGLQWVDLLDILGYILTVPIAMILYFITIIINLLAFIVDTILWVLGLFNLSF